MPPRQLLLNPGVARCGTTATWGAIADLSVCSTPRDLKELKVLMGEQDLAQYTRHFRDPQAQVLFESSPPYMAGGAARFDHVLTRAQALTEFRVTLLVTLRNLLARAFSHYWHDISVHHAVYGALWGVNTPDDPRRFRSLYRQSFAEALADPALSDKLLPDVAGMLEQAVARLGPERVRIGHTAGLSAAVTTFMDETVPGLFPPGFGVPRLKNSAQGALYHPGGATGCRVTLDTLKGLKEVDVPPGHLLLVSSRRVELLAPGTGSGAGPDLAAVIAAGARWTWRQEVQALPGFVPDYLQAQTQGIAALPEACFLAGQRAALLEDLARLPAWLEIAPPQSPSGIPLRPGAPQRMPVPPQ